MTFFDLTPRLVVAVVEGRERQRQTDFERLAWAVHQNAALQLSDPKKFPTLDKFMNAPAKRSKRQTPSIDRMMSIANMWNVAVNASVPNERRKAETQTVSRSDDGSAFRAMLDAGDG